MVKYAKPKTPKTVERGLRPVSGRTQETFPSLVVEKMAGLIEKILADSRPLNQGEDWVLSHVLLIASFRRTPLLERDPILRQINKHEEEGHRLGFSTIEIRGLNRVVLQKDQEARLDEFIQEVKKRKE